MRTGLLLLTVTLLWGCGETGMNQKASMSPKPNDGELAWPARPQVRRRRRRGPTHTYCSGLRNGQAHAARRMAEDDQRRWEGHRS